LKQKNELSSQHVRTNIQYRGLQMLPCSCATANRSATVSNEPQTYRVLIVLVDIHYV